MARFCLYSCTDLPEWRGRVAHRLYGGLANYLDACGHEVSIVGPSSEEGIKYLKTFNCEDDFNRWISLGNVDHLFLWTSKPEMKTLEIYSRPWVKSITFCELGITDQKKTIILDSKGTGADSELVHLVASPVQNEKHPIFAADRHQNLPVGVCLQVEGDWQFLNNKVFDSAFTFVSFLLSSWPEERFIVRPHPKQQDVLIPKDPRVKIVRDDPSARVFFGKCKCVAGVNSTSLIEAAWMGLPTYQFGVGPGHASGMFLKTAEDPRSACEKTPESYRRLKCAAAFRREVVSREVPIDPETPGLQKIVSENVVLPVLDG